MVKLNKQHWVAKILRNCTNNYINNGIQQQTIGAVTITITAPYEATGLYIITAYHTTALTTLHYIAMVANGAITLIQATEDDDGGVFYTNKQTRNDVALSGYVLAI